MTSVNPAGIEETVVQASGATSEAESGGAIVNIIPRDGGNTFRGNFAGDFSTHSLEGNNVDYELEARGLTTSFNIRKRYDVGGGGRPDRTGQVMVLRDLAKVRSIRSTRRRTITTRHRETLFYTVDLTRPAYTLNYGREMSGRLTWRASAKDRIPGSSPTSAIAIASASMPGPLRPKASRTPSTGPTGKGRCPGLARKPAVFFSRRASRSWTASGISGTERPTLKRLMYGPAAPTPIEAVLDSARNYRYGAPTSWNETNFGQINERVAISYVTGTHAYKAGIQFRSGGGTTVRSLAQVGTT